MADKPLSHKLEPLLRGLGDGGDVSTLASRAARAVCDLLEANACAVFDDASAETPSASSGDGPPLVAGDRLREAISRSARDGVAIQLEDEDGNLAVAAANPRDTRIFALAARRPAPRSFDATELDLLAVCARYARIAVARARDIERLEARIHRFELVRRVGMTLIEGEGIEETLQKVVDMVATTLDYSQTAVLLLDPDLEELDLVCAYGYGEVSGLKIPLSQGATGYAARHAEPVNIRDVRSDPRYVKGTTRGRSELAVPILLRGEVLGVLDVESPVPDAFCDDDIETLDVVASYAAAAIELARLRRERPRWEDKR